MLVDKPLCLDGAEGERMLAAARAHPQQVSAATWHRPCVHGLPWWTIGPAIIRNTPHAASQRCCTTSLVPHLVALPRLGLRR